MLQSMTGYARQSQKSDLGLLTWEIKTVNHRYLDLSFRLPDNLRYIEPELRAMAMQHLARGKGEAVLKIQATTDVIPNIQINIPLANTLIKAENDLRALLSHPPAPLNLLELLRWPGVIQSDNSISDSFQQMITELFQITCLALRNNRQTEGSAIAILMQRRLEQAQIFVSEIKSQVKTIQLRYENKLRERCHELALRIEPQRLEQEILFYIQRADIEEELDRLNVHMHEFQRQLNSCVAVGRRLDFILQEMNREINTLGAKSDQSDIARIVVELKVIIEQLREQVQNVE